MAGSRQNFIIQYNGREGSSAIISTLSGQKGVNVPLFEELDHYAYSQTHKNPDYAQALNDVFTTGVFKGERKNTQFLQTRPPGEKIKTTGFKWRVAGKIVEIAPVLKKHNVTVFFLQRRDFLGLACSSYVHNYGNRIQSGVDVQTHPQFSLSSGKDESEIADKFEKLNRQEFKLVRFLFYRSARRVAAYKKIQIGRARQLARAGVPLGMIYYEDFDADPKAFTIDLLARIGIDISATYTPYCGFEKVHKRPIAERINGLEKALKSPFYRYFEREYKTATGTIAALSSA